MDFFSPLRYPGGKGKVSKYFKQVFLENNLCDSTYVEPYAGGASVALSLLFSEFASKIIINDKDKSIYALWNSVLKEPESLCKMIKDCKIDVANWEKQRLIQKTKTEHDLLTLGFSTFFLNRVNRSGIIMAGIIGGKDQTGTWKMDARFNKVDLIKRIERIASYSNSIKMYNLDAVQLIKKVEPILTSRSFFYLDPPYFEKGSVLYMNHYQMSDHENISNFISQLKKQKWIISYDSVDEIKNLYSQFRQLQYTINYSASGTSKGKEIMIYSDNLQIPSDPVLNITS